MTEISIKTIAFDCFGTLAYIARPTHVFSKLAKLSVRSGINPRTVMANPWSLSRAATELGVRATPAELQKLESELLAETESIALFPETREVLTGLKAAGYQVAVCSNLALPYAAPIEALLGDLLDVRAWSFEVGAIKPDAAMYQALLAKTGNTANEILMVGDSRSADYEGARAAGITAMHLMRGQSALHEGQISTLHGAFPAA
jgi:HAD superfamily hydrolase (TIGR01549 family)